MKLSIRTIYGSSSTSANYNRLVTTSYGSWAGPYYDADGNLGTCYAGQYAETYTDTYTYHPAGGVLSKTFTANRNGLFLPYGMQRSNSVVASYTYDSSGRAATVAYPVLPPANVIAAGPAGPGVYPLTFTYGYDGMGRAASLTDNMSMLWTWTGLDTNWVSGVTYDVAGRMTGMQRYISTTSWDCSFDDAANNSVTESMTYNVNGQLTSRGFLSSQWNCYTYAHQNNGLQWVYSSTQNNGQITQAVDSMSGETINYTYDALKRLTQAAAAPISGSTPAAWTQNFGYDGFGNLTSKVVTGGSNTAPPIDPTTNRISGISYDANGNALTAMGATLSYDEANRVYSAALGSGGTEYYGYGPDNKRIYRVTASGREFWTVYGAHGEKLGTFEWNNGVFYGAGSMQPVESCVWFGGRMIWDGWTPAFTMGPTDGATYEDRVGTNRADGARFRPYGEEITSTQNEHVKFGTYSRDGGTGLDYAQQRYYASAYGRFATTDTLAGSSNANDPASWNRYSYADGDPVNGFDPTGQSTIVICGTGPDDNCGGPRSSPWTVGPNPCLVLQSDLPWLNCTVYTSTPVVVQYQPECPLVAVVGAAATKGVDAEFAPDLADKVNAALRILNAKGITPVITDGFRTYADQEDRYNKYLSGDSQYPAAFPGTGIHEIGEGIDFGVSANGLDNFNDIVKAMKSVGLTWGGDWKNPDKIHFELIHTPSVAQLAACEREHP